MKRIMVVDDEPEIAELVKIFLEGMDYKVDICSSRDEVMLAFAANQYWAVFCDYCMPDVTGDRIYNEIKEKGSGLAKYFIMITGAVLDEDMDAYLAKEGIRVITKPFRLEELSELLMELEGP